MPPKKTTKKDPKPVASLTSPKDTNDSTKDNTTNDPDTQSTTSTTSRSKRKQSPSTTSSSSNKTLRRSARSNNATSTKAPPHQTLLHLLSPTCLPLTRPTHETEALSSDPHLLTYTSTIPLPPFLELLAAVILSRPISHSLGQRSLRYLINPPRNLTTPKAILETSEETIHKWLEESRTQHKAKTAQQIIGLANACVEKGWVGGGDAGDGELRGLRGMLKADTVGWENARARLRELVMKGIKGMGGTGADIFLRRVQGVWGEVGGFVDTKTQGSLEGLGLPGDGVGVRGLVDEIWGELSAIEEVKGLEGNDEERKGLVFVRVLERAVGADLEGNVDAVLEGAGKEERKG